MRSMSFWVTIGKNVACEDPITKVYLIQELMEWGSGTENVFTLSQKRAIWAGQSKWSPSFRVPAVLENSNESNVGGKMSKVKVIRTEKEWNPMGWGIGGHLRI